MDMTLYALLLKKLKNQEECVTWCGLHIEIVDDLPESQSPNTIYFVKSNITVSQDNSGSDS